MMTQLRKKTKYDWISQTLEDLQDFGINSSISYLQSISEKSFKNIVKIKANEYALKTFKQRQEQHTKMSNLKYVDLKIKDYFLSSSITTESQKKILLWRTYMERFADNFRGGKVGNLCPLCQTHQDGQFESFSCQEIKKEIEIEGQYENIFEDVESNPKLIQTITKISQIRKRTLNQN